jgi:hypothetical protein
LKLSSLFAKYLYQHKQLNLPGIGVFTIDPSVIIPDVTDKSFPDFVRQIQFTQKNITAPDEDFINFIRTETGKIKPLAESDLDSFLSDGKILLNIGKPFHLEGIGSIQKTRAGLYEFTPGEPLHIKLEGFNTETKEDHPAKKTVFTEDNAQGTGARKLLIALGVIIGIALVIWGGYSLYNRNTNGSSTAADETVVVPPSDTARKGIILDSVQKIISSAADSIQRSASSAGNYKFVIERTYNKARAIRRFNQIKDNLTDIKMESSPDSTLFKLYFILPATPADTTRIKDSLKIWYGRKQVFIEQ